MTPQHHSTLDPERLARQGFPEVVYCEGKHDAAVADNLRALATANGRALSVERAAAVLARLEDAHHDPIARTIRVGDPFPATGRRVSIVTAGTSDAPVSAEAAATLEFLGHTVHRVQDVGVAGIHRVHARLDELRTTEVVIVVAGMEGALPSVVGGLVGAPVIAVPTSVGYGAAFGGLAALLGMLNSCAAGLVVVNIDNGFGAALAAHRILASRA
jgi:NCAIR mutase (PurE)-related protein